MITNVSKENKLGPGDKIRYIWGQKWLPVETVCMIFGMSRMSRQEAESRGQTRQEAKDRGQSWWKPNMMDSLDRKQKTGGLVYTLCTCIR